MPQDLQNKMFREMKRKDIFKKTQRPTFDCADTVGARPVFPAFGAIGDLDRFDEKLPDLDGSTMVILQAGNVSSGAFDPIDAVCDKANQAGAWVHIDSVFGLCAKAREMAGQLAAEDFRILNRVVFNQA